MSDTLFRWVWSPGIGAMYMQSGTCEVSEPQGMSALLNMLNQDPLILTNSVLHIQATSGMLCAYSHKRLFLGILWSTPSFSASDLLLSS